MNPPLAKWLHLRNSGVRMRSDILYVLSQPSVPPMPPDIQIRHFESRDAAAFRALNEHWIEKFFKLEEPDRMILGDPEHHDQWIDEAIKWQKKVLEDKDLANQFFDIARAEQRLKQYEQMKPWREE